MKKRWLAFLLLVSLLLPLAACNNNPDTPPATTPKVTSPSTENNTSPETTKSPEETTAPVTKSHVDPGLPEMRFDGEQYRIMGYEDYSSFQGRQRELVYLEDVVTNNINEAVRDRNSYIEDSYGVSIKGIFVMMNELPTRISSSKRAELPICESFFASMNVLSKMITEDAVYDLNSVPYLNLSQDYWDQNCRASMSIAHKLYMISGDIMISDKGASWGIKFNRDMVNNKQLQNPYDLVDANQWTYDNMYQLARQVTDIQDPQNFLGNTYGSMSEESNTYSLWLGNGAHLITKDSVTDMPEFGGLTEGAYDAMLKVATMQFDPMATLLESALAASPITDTQMFYDHHALFDVGAISGIEELRLYDIDFGLLPMPKLDSTSTNYYVPLSATYSLVFCIPRNVTNQSFVGFISEALAAESTDTLLEAYYDKTLVYKGLRREEDERMLTLIFKNRIYDLSYVFTWADSLITEISNAKNANRVKSLQSKYDKYSSSIEKSINTFLSKYGFV